MVFWGKFNTDNFSQGKRKKCYFKYSGLKVIPFVFFLQILLILLNRLKMLCIHHNRISEEAEI